MTFGYIRFFFAQPTPAHYTLYLDDKPYIKHWEYKDFTPYTKTTSGQHLIRITDPDAQTIYEKRINVKNNACYTYILGYQPKHKEKLHLFSLEDIKKNYHPSHGFLRLGHFALSYPSLDLLCSKDQLLFKAITYSRLTHYLPLSPETYSIFTSCLSESYPTIHLKKHHVKLGRQYSLYLVGDGSKDFPYECVPSIDGPCYLKFQQKNKSQVC